MDVFGELGEVARQELFAEAREIGERERLQAAADADAALDARAGEVLRARGDLNADTDGAADGLACDGAGLAALHLSEQATDA